MTENGTVSAHPVLIERTSSFFSGGGKPFLPPKFWSPGIMTRKFATGTKVFLNSSNKYPQGCLLWSDGVNTETGTAGGCAQAAAWAW